MSPLHILTVDLSNAGKAPIGQGAVAGSNLGFSRYSYHSCDRVICSKRQVLPLLTRVFAIWMLSFSRAREPALKTYLSSSHDRTSLQILSHQCVCDCMLSLMSVNNR